MHVGKTKYMQWKQSNFASIAFCHFLRLLIRKTTSERGLQRLTSFLSQLEQGFVYCPHLMFDIMKKTKDVSDFLPSDSMDYFKATDLVESLVEELETYRYLGKSLVYYNISTTIAKKTDLKFVVVQHIYGTTFIKAINND